MKIDFWDLTSSHLTFLFLLSFPFPSRYASPRLVTLVSDRLRRRNGVSDGVWRERDEWEETREWGELMPRERSKGNIIQPLGRECSCRSASPFSLLSSSLPVSSPPYHPARTGPFGPRRVSGEKWGRSTSQRKERYGHWAASVSPKFRSFRSSIAPLPRQSSPLPFTTFMSLRLSDGSVAYGTSEERMNVGKRRCQLPACTVRLLFGSCVTSRHPHSSLTHIVVTFSLPHPTRDRSERRA